MTWTDQDLHDLRAEEHSATFETFVYVFCIAVMLGALWADHLYERPATAEAVTGRASQAFVAPAADEGRPSKLQGIAP